METTPTKYLTLDGMEINTLEEAQKGFIKENQDDLLFQTENRRLDEMCDVEVQDLKESLEVACILKAKLHHLTPDR